MRPIGKPMMSRKEAQAMASGFKKVGKGIKSYGKNLVGGLR